LRAVHELSIMEAIVDAVEERISPARAARLRLQIGRLAGVVPDALRFCFEICARGTALQGAVLEIDEVSGRGRCRLCNGEMAIASFVDVCPCGSADVEVVAGQELSEKEVVVH